MPDAAFNVLAHGNAYEVYSSNKGSGTSYTPDKLAEMILGDDDYVTGSVIILWACATGGDSILVQNFAQQLATGMKSIVFAPTNNLSMNPITGNHKILEGGGWGVFFPCTE